jgi:tryptophan synthase alpha chain
MSHGNRLIELFETKKKRLLAIYFTAGFPKLDDTSVICEALQQAGADIIEIGMPFSDPLADGPTIQLSNQIALSNGMSLKLLLQQLESIKAIINTPIVLMGYLNPIIQFGVERFLAKCAEVGVSGLIIPDLPIREYQKDYQKYFDDFNLCPIFLVTPETPAQRLHLIDSISRGFVYAVSSAAVTGGSLRFDRQRQNYFEKLQSSGLSNPVLIGFGIADKESFNLACRYVNGAIIGSAFIKALQQGEDLKVAVRGFMKAILPTV